MKAISMTEFRKEPGERIIDVRRDGESFLLTKNDKPVAKLVPADCNTDADDCEILPDGTITGGRTDFIAALQPLRKDLAY